MKVTQLLLHCFANSGYDGTNLEVELFAVKLDSGRYVREEDLSIGGLVDGSLVWSEEEETDEEVQEFLEKTCRELSKVGIMHTDNPAVYGVLPDSFEVCGQTVSRGEVSKCAYYDGDDEPEPFVVDLN